MSLFSEKGLYADSDRDGLLDRIETTIVVPEDFKAAALVPLACRLVLPTTGASFPLIQFDTEVEDIKSLPVPLFLGESRFLGELQKTGKLSLPQLNPGQAAIQVVPKPFNKTDGLAVVGADGVGLEKALLYLARTFPYFEKFDESSPGLADLSEDLEKFLQGEGGSAEAFIQGELSKFCEEWKKKDLAYVQGEIFLPQENQEFADAMKVFVEKSLKVERLDWQLFGLRQNKVLLEKEKTFTWEVDDALSLLEKKIQSLPPQESVAVRLAVSESPAIRKRVREKVEEKLRGAGLERFQVDILSAYKPGFFWLTEKILPALQGQPISSLTIRFAEEKDDFSRPKRFYAEPLRWLQELYPVDEILAAGLGLPLTRIIFEKKPADLPTYEVMARDEQGGIVFEASFSPATREIPFLKLLPEWGTVRVTTGWLEITPEGKAPVVELLATDLEKIWDFYQEEVLRAVYAEVMKKTGQKPTTAKQPYFKRLLVEIWASEPDYRLGLDEEIISSLEAMHDELYFDTLDFLRGITEIELDEEEFPEDTSRLGAPGNVFPLIHPSTEGGKVRLKAVFEDWQAASPRLRLRWKEKGRDEVRSQEATFPRLKPKSLRFPALVFDSQKGRIENLVVELGFEKEADYLAGLAIVQTRKELEKKNLIPPAFVYPRLSALTLRFKYQDLQKDESLSVSPGERKEKAWLTGRAERVKVSTEEILSPDRCLEIVRSLSAFPALRVSIGGFSYETRAVPVIEAFLPRGPYVSLARLLTFKPTLFVSGRQHANEVSSTNYILKWAELLATDPASQEALKKMNFVLLPMENPDGAELAFELQKLTPFHSLHAGRYSSLGVDIGHQVGLNRPFLPEARVRKKLRERWLPDIYLNLHGYPSHEWVQPFSGYSPYLFRDYWIPRGWFAYFRAPRLALYEPNRRASEELRQFLIREMNGDEKIRLANEKFYDRYRRWASRWQPHVAELELHDGLNLYVARRSSQETRLTPGRKITFVEQTPELMDETAQGAWLDFLCHQGLTYLQAHVKYLSQVRHEIGRIEEEIQDRVVIELVRTRPGQLLESKTRRNP